MTEKFELSPEENISVSDLQRKCQISYPSAMRVIEYFNKRQEAHHKKLSEVTDEELVNKTKDMYCKWCPDEQVCDSNKMTLEEKRGCLACVGFADEFLSQLTAVMNARKEDKTDYFLGLEKGYVKGEVGILSDIREDLMSVTCRGDYESMSKRANQALDKTNQLLEQYTQILKNMEVNND